MVIHQVAWKKAAVLPRTGKMWSGGTYIIEGMITQHKGGAEIEGKPIFGSSYRTIYSKNEIHMQPRLPLLSDGEPKSTIQTDPNRLDHMGTGSVTMK